jgi:hypothetical protein
MLPLFSFARSLNGFKYKNGFYFGLDREFARGLALEILLSRV